MLCLILHRAILFITIVTAAALHPPQYPNQLIAASTPYNLSSSDLRLISQVNTTAAETGPSHLFNLTVPDAPSTVNDVLIDCGYGHELEYDACLDALKTFVHPFPDRPLTIGQRRAGGVCTILVQYCLPTMTAWPVIRDVLGKSSLPFMSNESESCRSQEMLTLKSFRYGILSFQYSG